MPKKDKKYSESTISALMEQHNTELKAIREYTEDIPKIKIKVDRIDERLERVEEKTDVTLGMVAKNTEDIVIIKSDISFIKHELKHKVDRDEFEALEKRVIFLEKKVNKI